MLDLILLYAFKDFSSINENIADINRFKIELSQIDYTVASVHAMNKWKGRDEQTNTEELKRCIDHDATKIQGQGLTA